MVWKETCDGHFQVVVLLYSVRIDIGSVVLPFNSGLGSLACQANAKAGVEEPAKWRHC